MNEWTFMRFIIGIIQNNVGISTDSIGDRIEDALEKKNGFRIPVNRDVLSDALWCLEFMDVITPLSTSTGAGWMIL